jgi:DNA-binding response OmpR family regulator
VTLVVLPDTDLRERLSRELIVCGLDAVAAPDWFAAAEIARARPVAAVVFDSGHAVMNGVGWRDGVARLRAAGATPVVVWLRAMGPAPEAASSNQPTNQAGGGGPPPPPPDRSRRFRARKDRPS